MPGVIYIAATARCKGPVSTSMDYIHERNIQHDGFKDVNPFDLASNHELAKYKFTTWTCTNSIGEIDDVVL